MALTSKQRAFVAAYAGNGVEAARLAGYSGSDATLAVTASDLLRVPKVAEAIKAREASRTAGLIATRSDRQTFWTQLLNDPETPVFARLKASELLGKSEADFVERHEHDHVVTINVVNPYAKGDDE